LAPTATDARAAWSDEEVAALSAITGGSVRHDPATRAAFAEDFGHLVRAEPRAVVSPRDVEELASVVQFAARRRLPLCARGRGYSQSGQSLSRAGLLVDLSRLDRIHAIDPDSQQAVCESGVRWRELTRAALQYGRVPRVLPLNLDMSVGGLLSAGGIGANSHQFGPAVAQVAAMDVVGSSGQVSSCSTAVDSELFSAVLAGQGRCAIIARASIGLRRAPARVRTFHLVYGDIEPWFADQKRILAEQRAHTLEAMCWMGAKGFRGGGTPRSPVQWLYGLQIGVEYDGDAPDQTEALFELSPWRVVHVDDEAFPAFVARYQPRFDGMQQSGAWQQLHPWLESLLVPDRLPTLLPAILDELPMSLGDGHRVLWLNTSNRPPLFATPEGDCAVCLAVLPTGVLPSDRDQVLSALARVDRMLRDAGGKRYLSGWLGSVDEASWQEHYGPSYERWIAVKRRFDPDRIFRSTLFPAA
jgi:cytokinin dehydrogenase